MEKSSTRRYNMSDDAPAQTSLLTGGESLEVWNLLKSNSNTTARNGSSQPIDSIWSSVGKSGKPDLAWKNSGTGMSVSHQNGSLEPWSGSLAGSSSAWGNKKDGSGWGSPSSSPTQNAGTEGWGMSTPTQQSWSQEIRSTSGWEQQDDKFGSAWKKMQGMNSNCSQNKTDPVANAWSHLNTDSTGDATWTSQGEEKPASQWAPGIRGNNASQSNWENGFPSSNSTSQTTSTSWGWTGPSMATGSEQQPDHPTSSAASLPAPSTWAQAAGRGLNISNSNKPTGGNFGGGGTAAAAAAPAAAPAAAAAASTSSSGSSLSKEDLIAQLVNSKEGWGKTPVRQDTTWDLDEGSSQASCSSLRKVPSSAAAAVGGASSSAAAPEPTSSHVNAGLANTGTAIWESSRESSSSASKLPSMAPIGSKDVGIKDRGASANICQKPLSGATGGSWVSQSAEFTEGLLTSTNSSQLSSLELNCDKAPSGAGGVWNVPEPVSAARCTSVSDTPWTRGSKETTRALSWSESAKSGSSSSEPPVLRHDSASSCGWNLEKEPARIGESAGQSLLPRSDSGNVFDGSLSSREQAQSWRAPGNLGSSSSSVAAQATSLNQGRAKPSEGKCDGIWQPQLSLSPAADSEWTTDQPDAGLSLWNPTSLTKPNTGWGDGPWSTKLKPPSSSAWNEGSDLYSGAEDRKLSGFETSSKSAQQSKPSLLQQLFDLGFHKEDVQAALLSNNMNIEQATNELLSNNNRKPAELESSSSSGQKCHSGQGMSGCADLSSISVQEGSSFGRPASSILNHLTTTESQVQQPPSTGLSRAGLQTPSSLANMTRSCTPNLQPQQFASHISTTGQAMAAPPLSSQLSGRQPQQPQQQQQVLQNQMLQQLKMAVQSGLMSHQPPNPMPSPALLLGLRQLVQLQNVLDWLLIQHQVLVQQNRNIGVVQPGQVEQLLVNIQSIKQQIVQQKWKISQLQKQAAPSVFWPAADQYKDFPKDFAGLQVKDEPFNPWRVAPPPHPPPPPPAVLPLLDGIGGGLTQSSVDLVTASKSHSGLPLNPPFLTDSAWSMSAWPSHSSNVPATTASLVDSASGGAGAVDSKTSGGDDGSKAGQAASEMVASSTSASDAKQPTSSGAVLDIEEFIPGKPWQGPSMKNADDDPYLTPGSMSHNVFNMSSIIEPHFLNALGRSNVGSAPDSHWLATSLSMTGSGPSQNQKEAAWAAGGPAGNQLDQPWAQTSFSKNTRPPPGLQLSFNRSVSWTPSAANRGEAWLPGTASSSLVLKNFPNQIDGTIMKALCQQHGPLRCFRYNPASRQVLVSYRNKEDAIQAKLALHSCVLANTPLVAEFIPDSEAARMLEQPDSTVAGNVGSAWPQLRGSSLPKKMTEAPYWNGASSSFWEGYGSIWGPAAAVASAEDHSLPVHGDLLGSQ